MSDLSDFKRRVYEPEVSALKQRIATLERERDEARKACEKAIRERRSLEQKEDDWHRAYERAERERDEAREDAIDARASAEAARAMRDRHEERYEKHKARADRYEKAIKEALHEAPDSPHSWRLVKKHLSAALAGEDA